MSEFKIGGKVIAIANADKGPWVKGEIRTVVGMIVCTCGRLKLDLGYSCPNEIKKCKCYNCANLLSDSGVLWCGSAKWRPLQELSRELSSTTVEEFLNEAVEV